jgi:uncharacterized protein (TIGR00369 family)
MAGTNQTIMERVKMERTRTITWEDPKAGARDINTISGLDYLQGIIAGEYPPPPAAKLLGYRITKAEHGLAGFELQPAEYLYNPFATVHGGIISTLLDSTMTASVTSVLDIGMGCATVEIKVNFVRPITADTGLLMCEARPIHVGKRLATVNGWLRDQQDVLYAHGVSTCTVYRTRK